MAGYSPYDIVLPVNLVTGVVSNQVVSKEFALTAGGSLNLVVKVKAALVTVAGAITAKLQTAINGDWVDSKTVSITASGDFYIKLNVEVSGDQTYLPLLAAGRIVISQTNAGDTVTISQISVLQQL